MFDETGDEEKSQGWTALVIDTNGNGKRDAYVEPNQPVDPAKDKRFGAAFYAVSPAPDGSIWGSVLGYPGRGRAARARSEPARDGARGGVRAAVQRSEVQARDSRRAAWTSIATASSGRRWRAATWPASIAASARAR